MFHASGCLVLMKNLAGIPNVITKRFKSIHPFGAESTFKYDVVIVGAGCIGSLIAFWLKKKAVVLRILVIDRDLTYKTASTVRSNGGIRQQFTLKQNVELSRFTAEFVQNIREYTGESIDVQFKNNGYLMLGTHERAALMQEYYKALLEVALSKSVQRMRNWGGGLQEAGTVTEEVLSDDFRYSGGVHDMLNATQLKRKFPWLNTDDIEVACLGRKDEGWLDPWIYLNGMKKVTKNMGVHFLEAVPCKFNFQTLKNTRRKDDKGFVIEEINAGEERVLTDVVLRTSTGETKKVEFKNCILATGCETGAFAQEYLDIDRRNSGNLQYEIPIERRKRYMYSIECRSNNVADGSPLLVDPAGFMFRKESANHFITGNSPRPEDEPPTDNLDVDYEYFDDKIWPDLAKRMSCFQALRVTSGWAGFYDYNYFDQNAIIGRHSAYRNMIIASGFSGHGVMHSAAVGRGVAELLLYGRYQTIDLSPFSFLRVIKNEPLKELAHV